MYKQRYVLFQLLSLLNALIILFSPISYATESNKTTLVTSPSLSGISEAVLYNGNIAVAYTENIGIVPGYPDSNIFSNVNLWVNNTVVAVDSSGSANRMLALKADYAGNLGLVYEKATGQGYNFDSPYKVYRGNTLITDEYIFRNANTGWHSTLDFDATNTPHVMQFAHAGYYLNYSTKVGGNWVNNNISGYGIYYAAPYLSVAPSDNSIYTLTFQPSDTYGTAGRMQLWKKLGATWSNEVVATDAKAVGNVLAASDGQIYACYIANGDVLKVVTKSGGIWSSETIHSGEIYRGCRVALAPDNSLFVASQTTNQTTDSVYLFKKSGVNWTTTVVDQGLTLPLANTASKAPSILFNGSNVPILVYTDASHIFSWTETTTVPPSTTVTSLNCTQPATYDATTHAITLPFIDTMSFNSLTGNPNPNEIMTFSGKLQQSSKQLDFVNNTHFKVVDNSLQFLSSATNYTASHARYSFDNAFSLNGGMLELCVQVPSTTVIPLSAKIAGVPKNYMMKLQQIRSQSSVFNVLNITPVNP